MITYAASRNIPQYISTTLSGNPKSVDFVIQHNDFYSFQLHLPDKDGLMRDLKLDESYVNTLHKCLSQKYNDGLEPNDHVICIGSDYHPLIKKVVLNAYKDWVTKYGNFIISKSEAVYSRAGAIDKNKLKDTSLNVADNKYIPREGNFYCERKKINSPVLLPDGNFCICSFDYEFRTTYGNLFENKLSTIRKKWILEQSGEFSAGELSPCNECEFYLNFQFP